ncbi:MAG TPA: helix-hairpin-helix domain-containing protein [Actinomycetes bacterium]
MRLTATWHGAGNRFEGDRELTLHALPADAEVTRATVTLVPLPTPAAGRFEQPIALPDGAVGDLGATKTATDGSTDASGKVLAFGSVEVNFHARRTLARVAGAKLKDAAVQVDVGGLFVELNDRGGVRAPGDGQLKLGNDIEDELPGLTVGGFRLVGAGAPAPKVTTVTVRSAPLNVTVRLGLLPPLLTVLGELTLPRAGPDLAAVLRAFLAGATVADGAYVVPLVVHSDAVCELDVTVEVEFTRRQALLPGGLREALLPFGLGRAPTAGAGLLAAALPPGAKVVRGATAGRATGAFEASRIVHEPPAGAVAPAAPLTPDRLEAQPFEVGRDLACTAVDLLLAAATRTAALGLAVVADADGKPSDTPLLPQPVMVRLDREAAGAPTWLSAPLPAELQLRAGRRYWLVLQALEGEAAWSAAAATTPEAALLTSADGGLSWHAPPAAEGGPRAARFRLRATPATFQMPVELRVGADAPAGAPAGGPQAVPVPLDRFDPLGRVDLTLDAPEVADAFNTWLARAVPPGCPTVEHLANAEFDEWVEVDEGVPIPDEWELTGGTVSPAPAEGPYRFADLGGGDAQQPTGLSQVVGVRGGCRYRFQVRYRYEVIDPEAVALAEVLWRGPDCGAERVDPLPLPVERTREGFSFRRALLDAPAGATQAEVRLTVPQGTAVLEVDAVSLAATEDAVVNGDLREHGQDGLPGWSVSPAAAAATLEVRELLDDGLVGVGNGGTVTASLAQLVTVTAGRAYRLELHARAIPRPGATAPSAAPSFELAWLDADGPQAGPGVVRPLGPAVFDRQLAEGTVPAAATGAELRLVLPPDAGVLLGGLAFTLPDANRVPVTFLAEAPGELTVLEPSVAYDEPEPAAPVPGPTGLCGATPLGQVPGERPPGDCHCPVCGTRRTMVARALVATRAGRPATAGSCPRCGARLVRLGGPRDPAAATLDRKLVAGPPPGVPPHDGSALRLTEVRDIGDKRAARLAEAGIGSVAELAAADPDAVAHALPQVSVETARRFVERARALLQAPPVRVEFALTARRAAREPRVLAVGGTNPDGTVWRLGHAEAVAAVEAGIHTFYVERPTGERVQVTVARDAGGRPYLSARPGAGKPDELATLPRFPAGAAGR